MTYCRVCSALPVIGPHRAYDSAEAAWEAWERAARQQAPLGMDVGSARAASNARLVAGTTKRAVAEADGLAKTAGTIGQGEWWRRN